MRKLALALLTLLLLTTPAFAGSTYQLDGVYEVGAGDEVFADQYVTNHTITSFVLDSDSSITALSITVQGSNEPPAVEAADAHWFDMATHSYTSTELTDGQSAFHIVNMPFTRIRLNVTTLTGADSSDEIFAIHNFGR